MKLVELQRERLKNVIKLSEVSQEYNENISEIERSIQSEIQSIYMQSKIDSVTKYFDGNKEIKEIGCSADSNIKTVNGIEVHTIPNFEVVYSKYSMIGDLAVSGLVVYENEEGFTLKHVSIYIIEPMGNYSSIYEVVSSSNDIVNV